MTTIRVANEPDARQLAELAEQTFRDTFTDQNSAEDMDNHCRRTYGEAIQAGEIANPEYCVIVADAGHRLVAYAQLRWGRHPACVEGSLPGEIQRLYVDKAWHGKGLAQKLMEACLNEMQKRSTDVAWLGVWEMNPRAISFYKKFDFREVGAHVFSLGSDPQRDIIMVRAVARGVT